MSEEQDSAAITNRPLAALLVRDVGVPEGAPLLAELGLSNGDITAVYESSESSIRSAMSRGRRGKVSDRDN